MFPTIPRSRLRSTKNSASAPSSTTATRISGPSALTTSMFCMKALQFVAPAPEQRDIDVATRARKFMGRGDSVARDPHQYKGLGHVRLNWPIACFEIGRVGVVAPTKFLAQILISPEHPLV